MTLAQNVSIALLGGKIFKVEDWARCVIFIIYGRKERPARKGNFTFAPWMVAQTILSRKQHVTKGVRHTKQIKDHSAIVCMSIRTDSLWLPYSRILRNKLYS